MSTTGLSDLLARWALEYGTGHFDVDVCEDSDGNYQWSASVQGKNGMALASTDFAAVCWQPFYDLVRECQSVQDLGDPVDWGRLA